MKAVVVGFFLINNVISRLPTYLYTNDGSLLSYVAVDFKSHPSSRHLIVV